MTEALGANSLSSRICWREEGCRGAGQKLCVHPLPRARARRTSLPWPRDLGARAQISAGHRLAQKAEDRILVIDLWYLSWSELSFLSITVDELYCSPAHFPESPPENVSGNDSVVNYGNFWPESCYLTLWEVSLN